MTVDEEINKLCDMLRDNYCLTSVIILANEEVEEGTQICASYKGNHYEHIGMIESFKKHLMDDIIK
jgi:hypothetical protein